MTTTRALDVRGRDVLQRLIDVFVDLELGFVVPRQIFDARDSSEFGEFRLQLIGSLAREVAANDDRAAAEELRHFALVEAQSTHQILADRVSLAPPATSPLNST